MATNVALHSGMSQESLKAMTKLPKPSQQPTQSENVRVSQKLTETPLTTQNKWEITKGKDGKIEYNLSYNDAVYNAEAATKLTNVKSVRPPSIVNLSSFFNKSQGQNLEALSQLIIESYEVSHNFFQHFLAQTKVSIAVSLLSLQGVSPGQIQEIIEKARKQARENNRAAMKQFVEDSTLFEIVTNMRVAKHGKRKNRKKA